MVIIEAPLWLTLLIIAVMVFNGIVGIYKGVVKRRLAELIERASVKPNK